MGDGGGGLLINLDRVAPSWIVSVSVSVIFHGTIKSRRFLALAHLVVPEKRTVKRLYVCVCFLEFSRFVQICQK